VVRVDGTRIAAPGLTGSGDEVVLLVEVDPDAAGRELAVDLLRGDERRGGWQGRVGTDGVLVALRLHWDPARPASSRLICRVSLDGREVARRTVLLGQPTVDAQGRFAGNTPPNASNATVLAYFEEWQTLFGEDCEGGPR